MPCEALSYILAEGIFCITAAFLVLTRDGMMSVFCSDQNIHLLSESAEFPLEPAGPLFGKSGVHHEQVANQPQSLTHTWGQFRDTNQPLGSTFLDCGRKPGLLEKTCTCTRETWKFHSQRFQLGFFLWGDTANHHSTVQLLDQYMLWDFPMPYNNFSTNQSYSSINS